MARRSTLALIALALALPTVPAFAQDWEGDENEQWSEQRSPDDLDVSVDVGVSAGLTFDTFHAPLTPYGEWVSVGSYGNVWRPRVAAGWRPYYYGRWEWTSEGWLWVSDEPYGWAVYHYGRWAFDDYYGWIWVPGYQWAPAWVTWRYSGDVVGWAPLAPGFSMYVASYPLVEPCWTFVPTTRFVAVPVYSVAYAPTYTRDYFYRTAPAPARPVGRSVPGYARPAPAPTPAWGGPAPRAIEQRIGRPLVPARVIAAPSPGASHVRGNEIAIFRPERAAPAPRAGGMGDARGRPPGFAPAPGDAARNGFVAAPRSAPERGYPQTARPPAPGPRPEDRGVYAPGPRPDGARGWRSDRGGGVSTPPPAYRPDPRGAAPGPAAGAPPPAYRPDPRGAPPAPGAGAPPPAYRPDPRGAPPAPAPGGGGPRGGGAPAVTTAAEAVTAGLRRRGASPSETG